MKQILWWGWWIFFIYFYIVFISNYWIFNMIELHVTILSHGPWKLSIWKFHILKCYFICLISFPVVICIPYSNLRILHRLEAAASVIASRLVLDLRLKSIWRKGFSNVNFLIWMLLIFWRFRHFRRFVLFFCSIW